MFMDMFAVMCWIAGLVPPVLFYDSFYKSFLVIFGHVFIV